MDVQFWARTTRRYTLTTERLDSVLRKMFFGWACGEKLVKKSSYSNPFISNCSRCNTLARAL